MSARLLGQRRTAKRRRSGRSGKKRRLLGQRSLSTMVRTERTPKEDHGTLAQSAMPEGLPFKTEAEKEKG